MPTSLANGLAAYWPCNELTGQRSDIGPGKIHLAMTGAVPGVLTAPGMAAMYDGVATNFLAVADASKLRFGNSDFSLSLWVFLNSISTQMTFLSKWANEAFGAEWLIAYVSGIGVVFNVYPTGVPTSPAAQVIGVFAPGSEPLSTGAWHHVLARKRADGIADIRIDNGPWGGAQAGTQTYGGGFANSVSKFAVGGRVLSSGSPNGVFTNGFIRQVGAWNRLLQDQECGELWGNGLGLSSQAEREMSAGVYVGA